MWLYNFWLLIRCNRMHTKLKFVIWISIIESAYLKSFFVSLKMKVVNKVLFSNCTFQRPASGELVESYK